MVSRATTVHPLAPPMYLFMDKIKYLYSLSHSVNSTHLNILHPNFFSLLAFSIQIQSQKLTTFTVQIHQQRGTSVLLHWFFMFLNRKMNIDFRVNHPVFNHKQWSWCSYLILWSLETHTRIPITSVVFDVDFDENFENRSGLLPLFPSVELNIFTSEMHNICPRCHLAL